MTIYSNYSKPRYRFTSQTRKPQIDLKSEKTVSSFDHKIDPIQPSIYSILTWASGEDTPSSIRTRKPPGDSVAREIASHNETLAFWSRRANESIHGEAQLSSSSTRFRSTNHHTTRGLNPLHTISLVRPGSSKRTHFFFSFIHRLLRTRAHELH